MDFANFILTKDEQLLFDRFKYTDRALLTEAEFLILRKRGLVEGSLNGKSDWFDGLPESGTCTLSQRGKELRTYQSDIERKARKEDTRYWITTGISIAAIVISIILLIASMLK